MKLLQVRCIIAQVKSYQAYTLGVGKGSDCLLQVLPELVQFMDKVHGKMMLVQTNLGKLEIEGDGATNPATKESGPRLMYCSG